MKDRYDVSDLPEAQFEPGSRGLVLKNLLGIKRKREMDDQETAAYIRTIEECVKLYGQQHRFTAADICAIHQRWLGSIYSWVGSYRQVNISKGQFPFAPAGQIARLMKEFEKSVLAKWTPCHPGTSHDVTMSLAVVHAEFILIHPFREGNGRLGRILSILMALQANLPPLEFGGIIGKHRQLYVAAVQTAMKKNYEPMKAVFERVIARTLRKASRI